MKPNLLAALLLSGACSAGWAQGIGGPQRLVLKALDTDGDGKLSAAEIAAAPKSLLALDKNGDGQITADELSPPPETAAATADDLVKQLMAFDKNGDGVLTPNELPERMQSMFTRGDTNHDGKLTPDEIRAMARRQGMPSGGAEGIKRAATMFKNDPILNALDVNHDGVISADEIAVAAQSLLSLDTTHSGEITAEQMRPRQQTPEDRVAHLLDEWDTDKDGKISKAEAPDRMQQIFESLDKNGDGFLDHDELLEYFKTAGAGQRDGRRPDVSGRPGIGGPNTRPDTKKEPK